MEKEFCDLCGMQFTFLERHKRDFHRTEGVVKPFPCDTCGKQFQTKETLTRHAVSLHGVRPSNELGKQTAPTVFCEVCQKGYGSASAKNKHKKLAHSGAAHKKLCSTENATIICPLCNERYLTHADLQSHLENGHGLKMETIELHFNTSAEFEEWKREFEASTKSYFVRHRGHLRSQGTTKTYYNCHCSGKFRSRCTTVKDDGKPSRKRFRRIPTVKMGKTCPARIVVSENLQNEKIVVNVQNVHAGHDPSVAFIKLTREERSILAEKIAAGVSCKRILKLIRGENELGRLHAADLKDLHVIARGFQLRESSHQNDKVSVDMWVKQQWNEGDSCVHFYKPQGEPCEDLMEDEFMLVIMTKYQEEEIAKSANKIIIDSTHCTNADFQLTTIMTVDEFEAGCPLAFCYSTRVNTKVMEVFFRTIKEKVGIINADVLMADDDPLYSDAWDAIMNEPAYKLLCSWHVDKNWRKNLEDKIQKFKTQCEVYKGCRVLLEIADPDEFERSLDAFLQTCAANDETKAFGEYFEERYARRAQEWAYCFRIGLHLNANLEAFHKKFKFCYIEGENVRRMDSSIFLLLQCSRDIMFERTICWLKNRPSSGMNAIAQSHVRSLECSQDIISVLTDTSWHVKTSSVNQELCVVQENTSTCQECPLTCPECLTCLHKYSCTCKDNLYRANMCKHIHAVCMFRSADNRQPQIGVAHVSNDERLQNLLESMLGMMQQYPEQLSGAVMQDQEKVVQKMLLLAEGLDKI